MDPLKPRLPQPPSPGLSSAKKEMNPKPNQVSDFFLSFAVPFVVTSDITSFRWEPLFFMEFLLFLWS